MCINLSVNQSVSQSFSQSVFQFVCQFVSRSVFVCLSVCHSVCFDRARSALFSFFFFSAFLGSSSEGNQRRQSPIEYRGNLYLFKSVLMSVRPPPMAIWSQPPKDLEGMDRQTDVWTYRFPLYSTGLCLLLFPLELLPCSHNS